MGFSLYIAKRYLRSASKNNAINIINGIASLGIIVGAAALFIVLSVFSGLVDFSLSFSNSVDPDLKASSILGKSFFISKAQEQQVKQLEGVAFFSKVAEERVLFTFNGKEQVTFIKGVDSLFTKVSTAKETIFQGQWLAPNTTQVVIGYGIHNKLSIGLFDVNNPLEAFAPKPGKGAIDNNAFRSAVLDPIGIYAISEELDSKYVFADLSVAQDLLGMEPNQISSLELKLKPEANEQQVISGLEAIFKNKIKVKNRAQLNDALYRMLNTENLAVYLIFTLVIIIALFNLIGALIMMILDKKSNLKTLYNLGAEVKDLQRIFLFQGVLLCFTGGIIGLVIGVVVVVLQQQFHLIMITETLAYPVQFNLKNILIVFATIMCLGYVASLIASSRVSKKLLD